MKSIKLALGELMEIRFLISDGVFSTSSFTSKVQDIVSEKEFLITPPVDNNIEDWIGRVVKITIPRKDGAYCAQSKIIDKKNEGALVFFRLKLLEDFTRIQRREFFRLKIPLNVNLDGFGEARTVDISGNGIAVLSELDFEEKDRIKGNITLDNATVEFCGTIVRCDNASDKHNLICIYFDDISRDTQETIIKFIYDKQVDMLKNDIPL